MIFISYSHHDFEFVNQLSLQLIEQNIKVWRDEYKILPGDSLTARIRGAIDQASLLCVVVSNSSFISQWVRQEIEAGLMREKQAVGFTIIPLLIQDVMLPDLLKDHLWIDFREGFAQGFSRLLTVIRSINARSDNSSASTENEKYFLYYAIEEGWIKGIYDLLLDIVSFDREERFCILTRIQFRGNEKATETALKDSPVFPVKEYLLRTCIQEFTANPARVTISANKPARGKFFITAEEGDLRFNVFFESKMLGSHRGETTFFNIGALFGQICEAAGIQTVQCAK